MAHFSSRLHLAPLKFSLPTSERRWPKKFSEQERRSSSGASFIVYSRRQKLESRLSDVVVVDSWPASLGASFANGGGIGDTAKEVSYLPAYIYKWEGAQEGWLRRPGLEA